MDLPVKPGFAHVSYEQAVRTAAELIPFLRSHAAAGELERRMPTAVTNELHRTGLIRALQPKTWGGMALKLSEWLCVLDKLGQGDLSVAWNVANLTLHHRTLALFSVQAQREVWGENPDALIAAGIAYVQGRARRVDGGLVILGTWNFCSGVVGAGWNMLACVVKDGTDENSKPVDWVQCILREQEYQIIDDWNTLGMRGTSSCSVKVDELFVPDHRVQSMAIGLPGHVFKGAAANPNPMFHMPTTAYGGHTPAAAIVGAAQGGVDVMVDWVKSRSTAYTGAKMRDFAMVQWRIGFAAAKVDAARLMLRNDCLEGEARMQAGEPFDTEYKLRVKRNGAVAVRMAVEAVDMLHEMAGANGIYDHAPLQKIFRDVHAASAHIHFNMDVQMTQWGLVKLGGEFKSPVF